MEKTSKLQMRRGNYAAYNESKMSPGEIAVVTDTRQAFIGMDIGDAEELAFKKDIEFGTGTSDHSKLTNRDIENQHPISAITGLQELADLASVLQNTGDGTGFLSDDGTYKIIDVKDGVGIQSIEQTTVSSESGGVNVVTVTKTDGSVSVFEVRNGAQGEPGAQGVQGVQGLRGEPGQNGTDGVSPTVIVSGIDGGNRIEITDAYGTKTVDVMDGIDGQSGTNGIDGVDGKSAYKIALDHGFEGTEAEWLESLKGEAGDDGEPGKPGQDGQPGADGAPGQDGKSAYQIAIDNGFEGTEAEWLDSLIGPTGPQGAPGKDGEVGQPGQNGADGHSPEITIVDGIWHVDGVSTGVEAVGPQGEPGTPAPTPVRVSSASASEFIANDNTYQVYTALSTTLSIICPTEVQKYGSLVRVTVAEGGSISGFTNATTYTGDDYSIAATGETWEFSILDTHVIGKQLSSVE